MRKNRGMASVDAIILAGGTGERLGGVSKADLDVSGRLLDRVLEGLSPLVDGTVVVVAPESVSVPAGVVRTMEDPPGGGPLAGIGAGLEALGVPIDGLGGAGAASSDPRGGPEPDWEARAFEEAPKGLGEASVEGAERLVLVCSVDSPGIALLAPRILEAARVSVAAGGDGAIVRGGEPDPFDQYLQGVYRSSALVGALAGAASRSRAEAPSGSEYELDGGSAPECDGAPRGLLALGSGPHGRGARVSVEGRAGFGDRLHGCGVRRALRGLDLARLEAGDECRDLDTPADLAHWRARLS